MNLNNCVFLTYYRNFAFIFDYLMKQLAYKE